jgi:hypothetical protein
MGDKVSAKQAMVQGRRADGARDPEGALPEDGKEIVRMARKSATR